MLVRNFPLFYIGLFPFFWFLGVSLLYFQVIIFVVFLSSYKAIKDIPLVVVPLILYIFVYVFSLVINSSEYEVDRGVASINNLSIWIFGVLLVLLSLNISSLGDKPAIISSSKLAISVIFLASIFGLFFSTQPLHVNSILGMVLNPDSFPTLVADSLRLKIFSPDWFNDSSGNRNAILSPYSTATAALSIMLFSLITHDMNVTSKVFWKWFLIVTVCVASTYSRLLVGVLLLYLFLVLLLELKSGKLRFLLLLLFIVSIPIMYVAFGYLWSEVNDLRSGSSSIRFEVYRATFETTMNNSPIIGLGVKDRGDFFIPLGSHSTYLGAFLKTGFIGFFFILSYVIGIIFRYLRHYWSGGDREAGRYLSVLTAFVLFMGFEDMDAAPFMSFLYFFILSMYVRRVALVKI